MTVSGVQNFIESSNTTFYLGIAASTLIIGKVIFEVYKRYQSESSLNRPFSQIPVTKATSLKKHYDLLKNSVDPITDGYGEYLIYNSKREPVTLSQYKEAFTYLHGNKEEGVNRTELISHKVKQINPNLEVTFIPRTLYDLMYIFAAIEEEKDENCELQSDNGFNFEIEEIRANKKVCWHTIRSTDKNPTLLEDEVLQNLAYRLNQYILEKLCPKRQPLTGQELVKHVEQLLIFLQNHRNTFTNIFYSKSYKFTSGNGGVAINFGLAEGAGTRLICLPMGVRNDKDAQVIRNAVALECSRNAKNASILYRAGDLEVSPKSIEKTTFSYGTSLFAGCVRDGTACVFYYTTEKNRVTYAVIVPWGEIVNSPYYVPSDPALVQLLAKGEFFHGRSKIAAWKKESEISGIWGSHKVSIPEKLKYPGSPASLASSLNDYNSHSHLLTPQKQETFLSEHCIIA